MAIVVIGETPYAEGMGDIRTGDDVIVQPGSQMCSEGESGALWQHPGAGRTAPRRPADHPQHRAGGIPVVTVLVSGRPLVTNRELAASTAFVAAWLPGSEGQGVADVLFGDHDFSGKLSFSWPGSPGDNYNRGDERVRSPVSLRIRSDAVRLTAGDREWRHVRGVAQKPARIPAPSLRAWSAETWCSRRGRHEGLRRPRR